MKNLSNSLNLSEVDNSEVCPAQICFIECSTINTRSTEICGNNKSLVIMECASFEFSPWMAMLPKRSPGGSNPSCRYNCFANALVGRWVVNGCERLKGWFVAVRSVVYLFETLFRILFIKVHAHWLDKLKAPTGYLPECSCPSNLFQWYVVLLKKPNAVIFSSP